METVDSPRQSVSARVAEWLFGRVDAASLAVFRLAYGLIVFWEMWRYFDYDWIATYYIEPTFWFSYPGFSWITPWPGNWMYLHFLVVAVAALCVAVGYRYRISATVVALGFSYIFLLDQSQYLNHFYLVSLISFAMIAVPCHRTASMDAAAGRVEPSDTAPRWALWLVRFLIGIPYFFGGVAKINGDWLQGEPIRMWLAGVSDFPVIGTYFTQEWLVYGFVWGGLLLDLLIVPLMLIPATRKYAYIGGVFFHLMNARLFHIGIFPWFMLAATTIYFAPSWPRFGGQLLPRLNPDEPPTPTRWTTPRLAGATLLAAFVLVQIALPFRHHLYDGPVSWTEEGHRFSWHMKLRSKIADASFQIIDPKTDTEWTVNPVLHLTERQARKMAGHPQMIRQFVRYLKEDLASDGYTDVQIRVNSRARLNGRPVQPLVDGSIDLAADDATIDAQQWIVPLGEPLPDHDARIKQAAKIAARVTGPVYQ